MKQLFENLFKGLKEHFIYALMAVSAFLLPIMPLLFIVLAFIVTDTAFGLWKMYRLSDAFSIKRLLSAIPKIIAYEGFVVLIFLIDKFILSEIVLLFLNIPFLCTKIIATALCVVELQSIRKKIMIVTQIDIWEKFTDMLKKAKEVKKEFTE